MQVLKIAEAGGVFYRAGMSYHNMIESVRMFESVKGREKVGTIFVFDKDYGFEEILKTYSNVKRVDMGKSYAPEIKKPALLVLTQAEVKRIQERAI